MVSARSNHFLVFENVSTLPNWLSDGLSALSTGSGHATRQLYTNHEESVTQAQRPIVLNGIPSLGTLGDFLERCVSLELPPITAEQRMTAADLEAGFLASRPRILGALLDVTAKANAALPKTKLNEMPRMADFARLGVAVERACAWPDGSFLCAYSENLNNMSRLALDSGLGNALVPLVQRQLALRAPNLEWKVSMVELLRRLRDSDQGDRDQRRWLPSNGRKLRADLDRLAPSLSAIRIIIEFSRDRTGSNVLFKQLEQPHGRDTRSGGSALQADTEEESEQDNQQWRPLPHGRSQAHPSESISKLLLRLHSEHKVLLRLSDDHLSVEMDGDLPADLMQRACSRHHEVLQHLQASPGAHILDYPDTERLLPHEFQELRIKERTSMGKISATAAGSGHRLRWHTEPTGERMREIADSIENDVKAGKILTRAARKAKEREEQQESHQAPSRLPAS